MNLKNAYTTIALHAFEKKHYNKWKWVPNYVLLYGFSIYDAQKQIQIDVILGN